MLKKIIRTFAITLVTCLMLSTISFASEPIRDMSYEEYLERKESLEETVSDESDLAPVITVEHAESSIVPPAYNAANEEIRLLDSIIGNKDMIDLEYKVDASKVADSVSIEMLSDASGVENSVSEKSIIDKEISDTISGNTLEDGTLRTAPIAGLLPVIVNEETLVNGEISTETWVAFFYNDSDSDGDTIVNRYVGGSAAPYILGGIDGGFVVQVTIPGSYQLLYQVEDSAGEFSAVIGFNFDVVQAPMEETYQIFEGDFSSDSDSNTYNFSIDFTQMDSAAVCLVRKGYVGTNIKVYDEAGNMVVNRTTQMGQPKNWQYIEKPSEDAGICNYTITAIPNKYVSRASDYRIIIGDKADTELMMSGIENTVLLEQYYEESSRIENAHYLPNKGEYWYKYRAGTTSVITVLNDAGNSRFKIKDINSLNDMFDSGHPDNADTHRTSFTGSGGWTSAEKARLNTTPGQEYYLVVYSTSPNENLSLREGSMGTAVGNPVMLGGHTTIYPSQRVSMKSSGFSPATSFDISGFNIPKTGRVERVNLHGILLSNVDRWRLQAPNQSFWTNNNGTCHPTVDMNYKHDSATFAKMPGSWLVSFKATSSANTLSFTPYYIVSYYCEYGD